MFSEVRILKELWKLFAEVRILKDLGEKERRAQALVSFSPPLSKGLYHIGIICQVITVSDLFAVRWRAFRRGGGLEPSKKRAEYRAGAPSLEGSWSEFRRGIVRRVWEL